MNTTKTPLDKLGIKALFLIWGFPQGTRRSQFMAQGLGMDVACVYVTRRQGKFYALLKYPIQAIKTLAILVRRRPQVVFVQNPPIFATLLVYLWGLITGTKYIIDSHTDALLASWWAWSLPLHRFLSRRAITTIVTNDYLQQMVTSWSAPAFILTDVPVFFSERRRIHLDEKSFNIVIISTASYDEPIDQVFEAARKLSDISFHITGNYRARQDIVKIAPGNVRFTGYVPDDEFYGLLGAAQAVMCLTTEDHTIQSGASEALWLGKPIITSDWPLLCKYFNKGTIHVDNTAESICQAIMTVRENLSVFETGILALQAERRDEWHQKAKVLIHQIQQAVL